MVARSTPKKGRRGAQTPTGDALTPPPGASGARPITRAGAAQQSPAPGGALAVPSQTPAGAPAGDPAGVAQFEAMVQALNTLPADIRRALTVQMGVPPPATSAASQRYDDERMDSFYANCIQPYIPEDLRSEFDSVEWSDVGTLFSKVCHSLELRKPGEDEKLKDILHNFWFEQRLDTRSKPQPAHVLELFKKKPEAAAADKVYREMQDGPLRDLLRLVLHLGVRASKPDPPYSQSPQTEVDSLREELLKLKHEARSVSVLAFSLLSEIQASRRKLMWEVTGAKNHELGGVSPMDPRRCSHSASNCGSPGLAGEDAAQDRQAFGWPRSRQPDRPRQGPRQSPQRHPHLWGPLLGGPVGLRVEHTSSRCCCRACLGNQSNPP